MYKIQTLNKIDQEGLQVFPTSKYEISNDISQPDAIVLRSFSMHDMEIPKSVKAIARAGAGVNNIPIAKCTENGIVVFNTPGANANGVKELVIAGLLMASRDLVGGVQWAKTLIGEGDKVPPLVEKGKANFGGSEIKGKTLGVIGLGAIGVLVANAAQSLGMNVIGYDPYISIDHAWNLHHDVTRAYGIEPMLAKADFITLQVPLLAETTGFINTERIKLMKDGVKILNFARGELVVDADIIAAIHSGKVGAYLTDFPNEELLKCDKVMAIPHLGASTNESEVNCAIMAAEQIRNFFENGNIRNSVNFPGAELERNNGARLLVTNKNIPNIISQITTILAQAGINIDNMLNKNKGDIAYNIIDASNDTLSDDIIAKVKAIDGVFVVRALQAK
ncbi:MAG: phosphoglycerate dehydrogenase [Bacteroidia bacterium]|nr:phosphoglycerate dehydrogenase [Bacteroidia bacterium]